MHSTQLCESQYDCNVTNYYLFNFTQPVYLSFHMPCGAPAGEKMRDSRPRRLSEPLPPKPPAQRQSSEVVINGRSYTMTDFDMQSNSTLLMPQLNLAEAFTIFGSRKKDDKKKNLKRLKSGGHSSGSDTEEDIPESELFFVTGVHDMIMSLTGTQAVATKVSPKLSTKRHGSRGSRHGSLGQSNNGAGVKESKSGMHDSHPVEGKSTENYSEMHDGLCDCSNRCNIL